MHDALIDGHGIGGFTLEESLDRPCAGAPQQAFRDGMRCAMATHREPMTPSLLPTRGPMYHLHFPRRAFRAERLQTRFRAQYHRVIVAPREHRFGERAVASAAAIFHDLGLIDTEGIYTCLGAQAFGHPGDLSPA